MSGHSTHSSGRPRQSLEELRRHFGLFSYRQDDASGKTSTGGDLVSQLGVRPGGIVEWLVEREGSGAVTFALRMMAGSAESRKAWVVVDSARECYPMAFQGWGAEPDGTVLIRPANLNEKCWAIEQCLRCPGVTATLAWLDERIPARVFRRWQLAAEVGEGNGFFFRPARARRESVWSDLRLLVKPQAGGLGDTRRLQFEVLYRRGGLGGTSQAWEIDHATGHVRLVSTVADSETAARTARA